MAQNIQYKKCSDGKSPLYTSKYPQGDRPPPPGDGQYSILSGVITLVPPSGVNFGTKPYSAKPFLVWAADEGIAAPNGTLGRTAAWQGPFFGAESTVKVGPGGTKSVVYDHGANGGQESAILAYIDMAHEPDSVVCFRRTYDDFTSEEAAVLRVRYASASIPLVADYWLVGTVSGATGQILGLSSQSSAAVYMKKNVGTIAYPAFTKLYNRDEVMNIYAAADTGFTAPIGTVVNNEGTPGQTNNGAFWTFNNKIYRVWPNPSGGSFQNSYFSVDPYRSSNVLEAGSGQTSTVPPNSSTNTSTAPTFYSFTLVHDSALARQWSNDIFTHRHGTLNNYDGKNLWRRKGFTYFSDVSWRTMTDTYPNRQRRIFQQQVSNGASPGTNRYIDLVVADDSEYHVILTNAAGDPVMLPPITWTAGQNIEAVDWTKYLPDWNKISVWVNQVVVAEYPRVS